jgi:hypothetical protein
MTDLWKFLAETGTFYDHGGSSSDDDDDDLPTIEEILYTTLQKKDFTTEDSSPENTVRGVEEVALEERGGSIDHSRSASGGDSGGSPGERAHHSLSWTRL